MCVIALGWDAHPRWQLIVAGNRDEFHERPSAPLSRWTDAPDIIAGRDLRSGGTWLGVAEAGRFVVVTNIRTGLEPDPSLASRGALVSGLLAGDPLPPPDALRQFNPFSLVVLGPGEGHMLANLPQPMVRALDTGLHGLSNNTPGEAWMRKDHLSAGLADWLGGPAEMPEDLFALLSDESPLGAVDAAGEGPLFLRDPDYGTRCSTVIAIDRAGQGRIIERRFDRQGHAAEETRITFAWPKPSGPGLSAC